MGLEDIEESDDAKTRVLKGYWDSKIIPEKGFDIAFGMNRTPKLDCLLESDVHPHHLFATRQTQTFAAERIKNLIRVTQKVYRMGDRKNQLKGYSRQISESPHFSPEDLNLCLPAIKIFSSNPKLDQLVQSFDNKLLYKMFVEDNIGKFMKDFNRRDDASIWKYVDETASFLSAVMRWTSLYARDYPEFSLFAYRLNSLSREMNYGHRERVLRNTILEEPLSGDSVLTSIASTPLATLLVARLNNSPENVMVNHVDCCITGPYGDHRAATMLYWLDQSVFTWELYAVSKKQEALFRSAPFGLGIFVKATGRHFSRNEDEEYLVFEGFPANLNQFSHIGRLKAITDNHLLEEYKDNDQFKILGSNVKVQGDWISLPDLIYTLGLVTARELNISKIFINAGHSNYTQYSVRHTVNGIVRLTGNAQHWDSVNQKMLRDPLTRGDLASFEVGKKKFKYTHFLRKPPLDRDLISKIQYEEESGATYWHGEGFFDTWYLWNHFIGNTFENWPKSARDAHPYAELVRRRKIVRRAHEVHPESYWNEGIGYCKGFEVDVKKECERLGIS